MGKILEALDKNRAWKTFRHAKTVFDVLGFFGFWPWVAVAGGVGMGVIATVPLWAKILIGLAVISLLLLLALLKRLLEESKITNQEEGPPQFPQSKAKHALGATLVVAVIIVAAVISHEPFKKTDPPKVDPPAQMPKLSDPLTQTAPLTTPPKYSSSSHGKDKPKGVPVTATGPVTVQSGGVASIGQQGGQTASTIINNVPQELHPPMIVSLAHPKGLTITVENPNDAVMEGIHWELVVFRASDFAFLSYKTQNIGYVKAHSKSAPYSMDLNSIPRATEGGELPAGGNVAVGDKLVGTLVVDCPMCAGKSLIISLVWGVSGWIFERQGDYGLLLPTSMTKDGVARFISALETTAGDSDRSSIR